MMAVFLSPDWGQHAGTMLSR